jgi:hypothetical protein
MLTLSCQVVTMILLRRFNEGKNDQPGITVECRECLNQRTTDGRGTSFGMAAVYLEPLDRRMEASGLTYARFMDDWVILAPTRWSLRRAVRVVIETLRELRVEQHPDKTFIGRIER